MKALTIFVEKKIFLKVEVRKLPVELWQIFQLSVHPLSFSLEMRFEGALSKRQRGLLFHSSPKIMKLGFLKQMFNWAQQLTFCYYEFHDVSSLSSWFQKLLNFPRDEIIHKSKKYFITLLAAQWNCHQLHPGNRYLYQDRSCHLWTTSVIHMTKIQILHMTTIYS